jgi:hypothetical protein
MKFFSLRHRIQTGSGAHPASYPMDIRGSYTGGRWAGRYADHSPSFRAKIKVRASLNSRAV